MDSPGISVEVGPVTVFVGPNNSGKSLALRDLLQWASQSSEPPQPWPGGRLLRNVGASWPATPQDLDEFLEPFTIPSEGPHRALRTLTLQTGGPGMGGSGVAVRRAFGQYGESLDEYCRTAILPILTVLLDGRSRFGLSEARQMTSHREPPGNHLMALVRDHELYQRVNREVLDAFGLHVVVDTSQPPNLLLALSDEMPPPGHWPERSYDPEVIDYQVRAKPILEFSDGVQIYTGLITALESISRVLVLVDEPEAFLHPTLARRLGARMARWARDGVGSVFASTHSADFLMGCVSEVPETSVVRLTYDSGHATARPLPGADVARLVRDPLLRSVDALSALFAKAAVVCEADGDRVFYEEINRRLAQEENRISAADVLFLNAQNWQTIPKILSPLRRLGVPAAAIVDLDAITRTEGWADFVSAVTDDPEQRTTLHQARHVAAQHLLSAGTLPDSSVLACKERGLNAIGSTDDRAKTEAALQVLSSYGLFVVSVGELEKWLRQLGLTNKQTWVSDMLVRLGSRGDAAYVTPGSGDVWDFTEGIATWLNDPDRRGMP